MKVHYTDPIIGIFRPSVPLVNKFSFLLRTAARTCREHLLVSTVCRGSPWRGKELQARSPLGRYMQSLSYMCQSIWCSAVCELQATVFCGKDLFLHLIGQFLNSL
jgi:hypothetical protein